MMNRKDFPVLEKTVYLDSAAGALKPIQVVKAIEEFYLEYPINSHSPNSNLGARALKKLNETRELIAELVDASTDEVIFTSGTTEALNMFAAMTEQFLKPGNKVIVSEYCHSSAATTFQRAAKRSNAEFHLVDDILASIDENTKVVVLAQQNNSVYQENDMEALFARVQEVGAVLVNDAAQAIMHEKVSLDNCDVIAFSANKLYGPFGIGALIVKKELLDLMKPVKLGGGAVADFNEEGYVLRPGRSAFEAGTLNMSGIIGLGAAIKYFNENLDPEHESKLALYGFDELSKLDNITMVSKRGDINILFNVKGVASQDVASKLGHDGIVLRSGKQCTHNIFNKLGIVDTLRMSFGSYNTTEDIDKCVTALKNGGDFVSVF